MTVADPHEIGCRYCGAGPGEKCRTRRGSAWKSRSSAHAIRKADGVLNEALPGWVPVDETADIIDFAAAQRARLARENGANL